MKSRTRAGWLLGVITVASATPVGMEGCSGSSSRTGAPSDETRRRKPATAPADGAADAEPTETEAEAEAKSEGGQAEQAETDIDELERTLESNARMLDELGVRRGVDGKAEIRVVGATDRDREADRCRKICDLARSTCDLEEKICGLTARHADDTRYASACAQARDHCELSSEACERCRE